MPVIVVGVDGSEAGDGALDIAAELAAATHHRLVAVHVAQALPITGAGPTMGAGALDSSADELADHCHMCCELTLATTPVVWSFEVRHGDPAAELLRAAADHDAACMVVARRARGRLVRHLGRSVTDRVLLHADRPVLVVPRATS